MAATATSLHALVRSSPLSCRSRRQDSPGGRAASCLMTPTARAPGDHLVPGAAAKATVSTTAIAVAAAAAAECCEDGASLGRAWRAVQGCNDWEGLVEPLDPLLGAELVRYGELVTACYKVFDVDPASKRYLKCRYGKGSMMREVGMGASGYTVTRYLYMTPAFGGVLSRRWYSFHSRWIGYVAVASDRQARRLGRRDVVVTFRGTATAAEWAANLMSSLTPARIDPDDPRPDVKVQWGFLSMYTSDDGVVAGGFDHGGCREQLISELSRILGKYEGEELSVTFAGHNMGGAMARPARSTLSVADSNKSTKSFSPLASSESDFFFCRCSTIHGSTVASSSLAVLFMAFILLITSVRWTPSRSMKMGSYKSAMRPRVRAAISLPPSRGRWPTTCQAPAGSGGSCLQEGQPRTASFMVVDLEIH